MALVEAGMERPGLMTRVGQEHVRVFFFSLGKLGKGPLAAALTALVIGIALALPAGLYVLTRNLATVGYSRSEEHTSELQSLMRISYAVFCLKKKTKHTK